MDGYMAFDRVLDALAHPLRRQILVALTEHNPQRVEGGLDAEHALASLGSEVSVDEREQIEMTHRHLPKLRDYDYVSVDRRTSEISKGSNWEEIKPLLQMLRSNEESLPTDWLVHSQ